MNERSEGGVGEVGAGALTVRPEAKAANCIWCRGSFTPRGTGGSAQKFCSAGHRQAFWLAARRWTMRAIEAGLLSVECLKPTEASVHAARDRV
jgi:hypothetical protein